MKDTGTQMNEPTMEKLISVVWKETEKEHRNYVEERIKRERSIQQQRKVSTPVDQTGLPDTNYDNEESGWMHHDEFPGDSPNSY